MALSNPFPPHKSHAPAAHIRHSAVRQPAAQKSDVAGERWRARVSRLRKERDAFYKVWAPSSIGRTRFIAAHDVNCAEFAFERAHFREAVDDWEANHATSERALDVFHDLLTKRGAGTGQSLSMAEYVQGMRMVFPDIETFPEVLSFSQNDQFLQLEDVQRPAGNEGSQWYYVEDAYGNKGRVGDCTRLAPSFG